MSFIPQWRESLKTSAPLFAPLLKDDPSLNLLYGLCAGALLWGVRGLPHNSDMQQAVRDVGVEASLPFLQMIVAGWIDSSPLVVARNLGSMAKGSPELKAGLNALLLFFMNDLMAVELIQTPKPSDINIQGNINGANVLIGSTQVIAGNLIIHYLRPKAERTCPRPIEEPVHFGGREAALNDLIQALTEGRDCAITALKGIGGMGKTTLARVLASRLYKDKVFRAVLWADVTRNPNFVTLINGWAHYADSSFDTRNQSDEQIAQRVKILLDDLIAEQCEDCDPSRVLVVLDDVWDNGKGVARLLMQAKPAGSTVLITTRSEALAIDLNVQRLKPLDRLDETDAAQLLHSYLPDADEDNRKRLGKALGGHPLAMELAARRILKEQGRDDLPMTLGRCIGEYEKGIPKGIPFSDLKLEQGEEKDDNLTRSLYHSYESLNGPDQARFRLLGILAYDEPFDVTLLQALWESEIPEDHCDRLRLLSLIEPIPGLTGWYRQHPLLRAYARALINTKQEAQTAFGLYVDHIVAVAEKFITLLPEHWNGYLAPQYPHILYIGDELVRQTQGGTTGNVQRALVFVNNVTKYLANRREVQRIAWSEMGLQAARLLQITAEKEDFTNYQRGESLFLNQLGLAWDAVGQTRKALTYYEQALPLDQALGDAHSEATTLNNIGTVWVALGEPHKALMYYEQALSVVRAVGDQGAEASMLTNIGKVWGDLGETHRALTYFAQALPLAQSLGDLNQEATTLNNIGTVWVAQGDPRKALEHFERALPLDQVIGNQGGEATTLNNIGLAWSALGEKRKALGLYEKALSLYRAVGNRAGEAAALQNIGAVYYALGKPTEAIASFEQSLGLFQAVEDHFGEVRTRTWLSGLYSEVGRNAQALGILKEAVKLAEAIQYPDLIMLKWQLANLRGH